ncbi:MAG: tetratricopeptide repeat protein [Spirochaetales bacterium]|nr:tetratricopeptide repeat protein [Spirochaetales bacterium]
MDSGELSLKNLSAAYFNRGICWSKKFDFDKAVKLNPNFADAYFNRGGAYCMKGDKNKSLSDLKKAVDLDASYKDSAVLNLFYMNLRGDKDFQKLCR